MKDLIRFLVGLFAPFALIFGGAAIVGAGTHFSIPFLIWTGAVVVLAGIVWGAFLMFVNSSFSWFD